VSVTLDALYGMPPKFIGCRMISCLTLVLHYS
jgi:hypothetical protein